MSSENKKGYLATYGGALIPLVTVIILIIPITIFMRTHSAQLELGGFLFVAVEAILVICGLFLIPVSIYFVLKRRGYEQAGRTVKYVVLMVIVLYLLSVIVQYTLPRGVSKKSANDLLNTIFYVGLAFVPFLARWCALRDNIKNNNNPTALIKPKPKKQI